MAKTLLQRSIFHVPAETGSVGMNKSPAKLSENLRKASASSFKFSSVQLIICMWQISNPARRKNKYMMESFVWFSHSNQK